MLEQPVINLITTPLVAGVVGYITNKLAIKMLFRPYKPKWYTLGWQGIVPKTRPMLADKISEIVGQKLLAHDDFLYALEHNDIKNSINNIILNKLSLLSQKAIYAIIRLLNIEDRIIANKTSINEFLNNTAYFFINQFCEKHIDIYKLQAPALKIIENFNIENAVSKEIHNTVAALFNDNKKLKELLSKSILNQKDKLVSIAANIVMNNIAVLGTNKDVQKILIQKIIEFKNNMFSSASGMDVLKAGFISLVLSDEKIANMVKEELPSITYDLSKNKELYKNFYNVIEREIDKLLDKNIVEVAEILGCKSPEELSNAIQETFINKIDINNKIVQIIMNKMYKYNNLTINEVLNILQIDIKQFIKIDIMTILGSSNYKTIKNNFISKFVNFVVQNAPKISSIMTELLIKLIKGNLKYALNAINIEKIVKDKINALPLPEVENMLFSFMKEHFKWINILGFFIGFIIGLIQALSVHFMG